MTEVKTYAEDLEQMLIQHYRCSLFEDQNLRFRGNAVYTTDEFDRKTGIPHLDINKVYNKVIERMKIDIRSTDILHVYCLIKEDVFYANAVVAYEDDNQDWE